MYIEYKYIKEHAKFIRVLKIAKGEHAE